MSRRTRMMYGITAISAALAVAVSAVLPAGVTSAAPPATVWAGKPAAAPGTWVTLITGDRVLVRPVDGRTRLVVEPAPRIGVPKFQEFTVDGDRYVLPADAASLVRDGVLDRQLFNVTGLIRQGYDDTRAASVPLLVRYADSRAAQTAAAPPGAKVRRTLPGVRMAALDESKASAPRFWAELTRPITGRAAPAGGRGLAGGVQRVWLNGKVRASLDQSVPQIGAPAAWSNGLTGTGVTVAVLDTGIDTRHADFAARIGPTKDFSGKGSVEDGFGHGTHVASIASGSGAASGGVYKGVAPGATLAIGKVLDDSGFGSMDSVLAGMEWAAGQVGAKVVNMSLGAGPSDGTDPVSVALNDLTNQHGTLFVVAAGNEGSDEAVSAPAAADAALAVGSVSRSDVISPFSNRGPRLGDGAVKPDLVAPGENIVAARPAGVVVRDPVGDAYQRISGTSMATPHVAGSAALLVQQHPDWKADRIKAALLSTAAEISGAGPYAVGTGRVDVARATGQPVTATGSVSTYLPWPNLGTVKKQPVTWYNTGLTEVTLSLSASLTRRADGQPAPSGLVTLSANTVTIPAGGSAPVEMTVSAQVGGMGEYSGVLTGRSADGAITTRTALSVFQEEEKHDLTANFVDRDGSAATGANVYLAVIDLDHAAINLPVPGEKIRLPRGRYAIVSLIETPRAGQEPTLSLISYPELALDHDTALTLDARDGKRVSLASDDPLARGGYHSVNMLTAIRDCECTFSLSTTVDPRFYEVYAATVPGTSSPSFAMAQARRAVEPDLELYAQVGQPFEVPVSWLSSLPPAEIATLAAVYGGNGTAEDLAKIDGRGKLVVAEIPIGTSWDEVFARTATIKAAGAKAALLIPTSPALSAAGNGEPAGPALPTMVGSGPTVQRFLTLVKAGEVRSSYVSRPYSQHRYELAYGVTNQLTTAQVYQPKTGDLVAVRTAYHDNAADSAHHTLAEVEFFGRPVGVGWTMPVRGGQERTEYFTPGTWTLTEQAGGSDLATETLRMEAAHDYHVVWNKAVAGPTLRGASGGGDKARPWAWRQGNALDVVLPMLGDSAGRPRMAVPWGGTDSGSISLYREGQLVSTVPAPDAAWFEVPDAAAGYRLVAEANRAAGWWPLSTKVTAAWTFRSSAADDGAALPLLTVRFDPAVDLRNRAPGGTGFSFPAYVARQGADTVSVTGLTVEVSYDDGQTWQPAAVTAAGDHWTVRVEHPAGGYASLRTKATDADGNTVEQTVLRAYEITSLPQSVRVGGNRCCFAKE